MNTKSDILKSTGHFIGGVGLLLIGIALLLKSCDSKSLPENPPSKSQQSSNATSDYSSVPASIRNNTLSKKDLEKLTRK